VDCSNSALNSERMTGYTEGIPGQFGEPIVPPLVHNRGFVEDRNFPGRGLDHEGTRLRVSNYFLITDHPGAISQGGSNRDAKLTTSTESVLIRH